MDDVTTAPGSLPRHAASAAERAGIAQKIAEARADIAAGRVFGEAEVDAWVDSLGTDHELPAPGTPR